jgi:hypothetical protein
MTASSKARIEAFVDWFIRSEYVQNWSAAKDGDYFNEPERAERVAAAAENGAYGATHAEVIEDLREAFDQWFSYDRQKSADADFHSLDRFEAAVHAHFDAVEAYHEKAGTLWQEVG